MFRNFSIGILILCFGFSSINAAKATQVVEVQPVIVQPYASQELDQQMLNRDRVNRDEEIQIQRLIEENDKLTQETLARQEDEGLKQIDQTMLSYRNAIISRDRARILANSQMGASHYGTLINLTEDADEMTVHQDLVSKSGLLAQKFQMLSELKDEMAQLNEKLRGQGADAMNQNTALIEGYKKIAQQQQDKIQMLVDRLDEMDHKISRFDEIIARKDEKIARLKDDLAMASNQLAAKDEMIDEQKNQLAILLRTPKDIAPPSTRNMELPPILVSTSNDQQQPNRSLSDQLAQVQSEISAKDQIIQQQKDQIDNLQKSISDLSSNNNQGNVFNSQLSAKQAQAQVDLLKSELESKITEENDQGQKSSDQEKTINRLEDQIALLKAQSSELLSKEELVRSQEDQMDRASEQLKNQGTAYADLQAELFGVKNRVHSQDLDLKAKDETIRWLNQVLAVVKNKASYYQLTSRQDRLSMHQIQRQVQDIKDDFAQRFKSYDQFEKAIVSLNDQVSRLGMKLTQKREQVDLLRTEINDKVIQEKIHGQQEAAAQQDMISQLKDKEDQIVKMKADILNILQEQANKEIYRRHAAAQVEERFGLSKQLIDLQQEEAALLEEKSKLALEQYGIFDRHFYVFENRMKVLIANHQLQDADLKNRMEELKNELDQKDLQVGTLSAELKDKIEQEKNQIVLAGQIQDLQERLAQKEGQIAGMKTQIQSGQESNEEADSLKQQMASMQDKTDQLQQQLDNKTAQFDQMTSIIESYQKKLESKDSAYNEQLRKILSFKDYQAQMEKETALLNARLQEREAQTIKVKKEMYDLEALNSANERDDQAKDLSLSIAQQKMMDDKINGYQERINGLLAINNRQAQQAISLKTDLALARQELKGMPSSDEIEFLRAGLKKAALQLKQKEDIYLQVKANADEYEKKFKEQSAEFQTLKQQLQDAYDDLSRKNEDLKYKDMEVTRLKERSVITEGDLRDQIRALTQKHGPSQRGLHRKKILQKQYQPLEIHGNKLEVLKAQLENANLQIKDLQEQLDQMKPPSNNSPLDAKLKQALVKIEEQGRIINVLVNKLQEAGLSVDLSRQ